MLLICTRADKNTKEMNRIAHPVMENYAKRVGADFIILDHQSPCKEGKYPHHYKILKIGELLNKYDRVLHLDTDIILNKNCPNIFDAVPVELIGTIFEDVGSRKENRSERIGNIQKEWGRINWESGYINTGVFLVSKCHQPIFNIFKGRFWMEKGWDDVHLGYEINYHNWRISELDFKWNHMIMFSEDWNNNADRFKSYIIHYAGGGIFEEGIKDKVEQMERDHKRIYEK